MFAFGYSSANAGSSPGSTLSSKSSPHASSKASSQTNSTKHAKTSSRWQLAGTKSVPCLAGSGAQRLHTAASANETAATRAEDYAAAAKIYAAAAKDYAAAAKDYVAAALTVCNQNAAPSYEDNTATAVYNANSAIATAGHQHSLATTNYVHAVTTACINELTTSRSQRNAIFRSQACVIRQTVTSIKFQQEFSLKQQGCPWDSLASFEITDLESCQREQGVPEATSFKNKF